jgi:hypothetical protein
LRDKLNLHPEVVSYFVIVGPALGTVAQREFRRFQKRLIHVRKDFHRPGGARSCSARISSAEGRASRLSGRGCIMRIAAASPPG